MKKVPAFCTAGEDARNGSCFRRGFKHFGKHLHDRRFLNDAVSHRSSRASDLHERERSFMFCRHCRKEIEEGVRFCTYCGKPVVLTQGNRSVNTDNAKNPEDTEYTAQYSSGEPGAAKGAPQSSPDYTEQYSHRDNVNGGGAQEPGRQDYTQKFNTQNTQKFNAPNEQTPTGRPGNDPERRGSDHGENYIPPAGLRNNNINNTSGTKNNNFTILLGVIASALFVTLVFLLFNIFRTNPIIDKGSDASSEKTASSADSSRSSGIQANSNTTVSPTASGSSAASSVATVPLPEEVKGFEAVEKKANSASSAGTMNVVSADVTAYPNVKLYCSLTDNAGEGIVLQSPTAGIKEAISGGGEIEREIVSIERLEGNQGIGFDILVDKSDSMSGELSSMQSILTDFISSLDYASGDAAEIISFDTYVMYMCMYTNNMTNLLNGISNMSVYGRTALYDALVEGISNAGNRTGANCVIAFTDGEDNESRYSYEEVVNLALSRDVPVYIIGFGNVDSGRLDSLAQQTGGCYWDINAITDMSDILSTIYEEEKDLYCIEYASDGAADPYTSRSVSCAIADDSSGGVIYNYGYTAAKRKEEVRHESRYELVIGDYSWSEANSDALRKGGHLVTITSQEEMNQISAMAENAGLKYIWMGGYTSVRNGAAYGHWTTGEPFAFAPWYPGEPSRNDLDGAPEFYLIFWNVEGVWSFNDERDDVAADLPSYRGKMGYVIEYES